MTKLKLILCLCAVLPITISSGATQQDHRSERPGSIIWSDYLEAIMIVESQGYLLANDPYGAHLGRGPYQISETTLKEYKDYNWGTSWITPQMLYNPDVAKPIALWYLGHCERKFIQLGYKYLLEYLVLSAYNRGVSGTLRYGIGIDYVERVLAEKEKIENKVGK